MANVTIKAKDLILALKSVNDHVLWQGACDTLAGRCGDDWVASIWIPDLPSAPSGTPATQPATPPMALSAPPVDVVEALNQIAEAVNKASSVLDEQHLMVASGAVTVDVNVMIPGTDIGAVTHLSLQIGPKPYN